MIMLFLFTWRRPNLSISETEPLGVKLGLSCLVDLGSS